MTAALPEILGGYLDLYWQLNPVEATFHGRTEYDGAYARFDRASVRAHVAALRSYTNALEEVDVDSLDDEIDRTAALHAARHDVLRLERERPFATNPAFHLSHALNGLFLVLMRRADAAERGAALLDRLRALPEFLTTAAEVLTEPDRALTDMALSMLPGGLQLVREGLDAAGDMPTVAPLEMADARSAAVGALTQFGDALALKAESATDTFPIGRELFDRKLHTAHMINDNADELLRFGERLRAEAIGQVERIAAEIAPGVPWRDLTRRLRDAPLTANGEALREYDAMVRAAREFTEARHVMHVVNAEIDVTPTPAFLRPLVPYAAYQAPGAFDAQQRGKFFVTLPEAGEVRRTHPDAEVALTVVHEAFPGHHAQMAAANDLDRVVRRILGTPATREGWALYCESLMAELGFLRTPEQRFFQAHNLLWRALRVIIDVSLHTRGMSVTAAAAILREELGFDEAVASAEATRYCAYPTYQLCYAVGRREILRLREDVERTRGAAFTLGDFHDTLLRYGAYPTALARWGMDVPEREQPYE